MKHEPFTSIAPTRQERKQQVLNALARPENVRLCEAVREYKERNGK
jgi:hypothetical protein